MKVSLTARGKRVPGEEINVQFVHTPKKTAGKLTFLRVFSTV